ncbi:hypothetical protein BA78_8817 [Aspergillus fumigatus]|nr:hypothetical protein BA78_8817 [Aspergillus fumigatus]
MPGVPPDALQQLKKGLKAIFSRKKKKAQNNQNEPAPAADKPVEQAATAPPLALALPLRRPLYLPQKLSQQSQHLLPNLSLPGSSTTTAPEAKTEAPAPEPTAAAPAVPETTTSATAPTETAPAAPAPAAEPTPAQPTAEKPAETAEPPKSG